MKYIVSLCLVVKYVILTGLWGVCYGLCAIINSFRKGLMDGVLGHVSYFVLRNMGVSFIKIGQALATRPDVIGSGLAVHLGKLQDEMPAFKLKHAIKLIETRLGIKIKDTFKGPVICVASASIAQVYKGLLGREMVAIKLLRPNIAQKIETEIFTILIIVKSIERISRKFRALNVSALIFDIKKTISNEIDLRNEAVFMQRIAKNFAGNKNIIIPKIHSKYIRRDIIIMNWIESIGVEDIIKGGHFTPEQMSEIAQNLVLAFFEQVYIHGFFHGDLHTGNILVQKDCKIAFVDFGIMCSISRETKGYITKILYGYMTQNYEYIAKMHIEMGLISAKYSVVELAQHFRMIGRKAFGQPVAMVSQASLLGDVLRLGMKFDMKIDPNLVFLQKNMILIEGVAYQLDPKINIWNIVAPWIIGRYSQKSFFFKF